MVAYTDFSADPNSVPKINGLPGIIDNIQKGYMLAQLPEKMRNEREQTRLATERAQMENQYYPQKTQADIAEARARAYLLQQQGQDLDPSALMDYLNKRNSQQNMMPPSPQGNQPTMGNPQMGGQAPTPMNQQPVRVPMRAPMGQQQVSPQMMPQEAPQQAMQQPTAEQPNSYYQNSDSKNYLLSSGNPDLYAYDEAYENDPGARKYLERHGYEKSVSTQIDPTTGKLVSITKYPSGKQEATIIETGGGVEGRAFQEEEGKNRAKALQAYRDKYASTSNIDQNISQLKSLVENPEFTDSVGPLNSVLVTKFGQGSPAVKQLNGQMKTYSGQIQADMATSIPGNAAKAKLIFVQSIKPDTTDTADGFIGKLQALDTANKWSQNYSRFVMEGMANGLSEDQALTEANKAFPWDSYKSNMQKTINQGRIAGQLREKGLKIDRSKNGQFYVLVPTKEGAQWLAADQYDDYMDQYKTK